MSELWLKDECSRALKGYRDRVILELLYDTAIRRAEVSNIRIEHMDLEGGYIHIHGKRNKQRVVPVSKRMCELINNDIKMVRSEFINNQKDHRYLDQKVV